MADFVAKALLHVAGQLTAECKHAGVIHGQQYSR
jgi:hypothetical protein